jgi:hypothetical protein
MEITGLYVYGATTFLNSEDGSAEVSRNPVFLPASFIDAAIAVGSLKAGAFQNVRVNPPPDEWPERWKHLRE